MPIGNGGIIGPANVPTITTASGVWSLREQQQAQGRGAWPLAIAPDPYFEYTTLLLPGNGTDGQNNNAFLDGSTNNFTITRNGNTTQGTFSPFSQTGWGNYFSGSNSVTSASLGTAIGTSNFSLEFFIYQTASAGIITPLILSMAGNNIYLQTNSGAARFLSDSGIAVLSGGTVNTNTWNHLVATRQGSTVRLFVNGVLVANTTSSTSFGTPTATIGGATTLYLASTRVCIGSVPASYQTSSTTNGTTIFTPPTSLLTTSSQGATAVDVKLLTCQSNRFIDISDSPKTLTTSGSPTVVAFSPFNPTLPWIASINGGSGYFDGSGDYLNTTSTQIIPASTTYTVEAWFYFTGTYADYRDIICQGTSGNANRWLMYINLTTGVLNIQIGVDSISSGVTISPGRWYYAAFVNNAGAYNFYVNGTSVASGTNTTIPQNTTLFIGSWSTGGTEFYHGYISSVRISNSARTISTPTNPYVSDANTRLLLNFTNAGIYDATSKNDLETLDNTVNGVRISTAQSQFGGSSIYFDGTGTDYLWIQADQPFQRFGTAPFTIELWIRLAATGSARGLVAKGTSTTGWLVSLNTSNQVVFTYGTSTITSTGTISAGVWTYIAVVREGTGANQTKIYIGGVNDGTGTVSTDFTQTSSMYIGADRTGGSLFSGYMQDVRITNGYARTVTTVPTAAFPTL